MKKRIANVKRVNINSVAFSSIFAIGDSIIATPKSRGIAVQQEEAVFSKANEVFFKDYDLFNQQPKWITEKSNVMMTTTHHTPNIYVNYVAITGVSLSSIAQIGSIDQVDADARIKHFRRLRARD